MKQVTGGLLILYVGIIVLTTMLAKDVLDKQTVYTVQTTLDLPTAITLVIFSILTVKLEMDKPKYRGLQKSISIDTIIIGGGLLLILALIYLKYFM